MLTCHWRSPLTGQTQPEMDAEFRAWAATYRDPAYPAWVHWWAESRLRTWLVFTALQVCTLGGALLGWLLTDGHTGPWAVGGLVVGFVVTLVSASVPRNVDD